MNAKIRTGLRLVAAVGLLSGGAIACSQEGADDVATVQSALTAAPFFTPIVLSGSSSFSTIPSALLSTDKTTFSVYNQPFSGFQGLASQPGVKIVSGDFNADTIPDLALTGGSGWTTIPVAFGTNIGTYRFVNLPMNTFPGFASQPGVMAVSGDFDGDGRSDIALTGSATFNTIPFASSNGDGTFKLNSGSVIANFPAFAAQPGVKAVAGDFNGDGKADVALVGGSGWTTLPVALGHGDGSFTLQNANINSFQGLASQPGVKVVPGDFNHDGRTDIALTGGAGWNTVPVAVSTGTYFFVHPGNVLSVFPGLAAQPGVLAVGGDFDGDGYADIALTGGAGWMTIPLALSKHNFDFSESTPTPTPGNFPAWATFSGAKAVGGY